MNDKIKYFLVKVISITFAIIIIISVFYNLFLAERLENIDKVLSLTKEENRTYVKDKIRHEINRSLEKEVYDKNFRQDLYYRLKTVNIKVPDLKDHLEDIDELIAILQIIASRSSSGRKEQRSFERISGNMGMTRSAK